jgi:hypothetical protein
MFLSKSWYFQQLPAGAWESARRDVRQVGIGDVLRPNLGVVDRVSRLEPQRVGIGVRPLAVVHIHEQAPICTGNCLRGGNVGRLDRITHRANRRAGRNNYVT